LFFCPYFFIPHFTPKIQLEGLGSAVSSLVGPGYSGRQVVIGRPFVKQFTLSYRTIVCLSVTLVYCGQAVEWIRIPLGK